MTIYLLNALPNALLVPQPGEKRILEGITAAEAAALLANGYESAIGHASTAQVLTEKLGIQIAMNRVSVNPVAGDVMVVGAFTPPRRLNEGEFFSEAEILACPVNFCVIRF